MEGAESTGQLRRIAEQLNSRAARRAILILFGITLATFAAIPVIRCLLDRAIKDYQLWFDAGRAVLHRQDIYPRGNIKFPFMYPPPCAVFLAAISLAGRTTMVLALTLLNCAAWVGCIVLSVRLVAGRATRQDALLYLVPNLLVLPYVWGNFFLGQPSLVLLALLLAALVCLQRGAEWPAGALIALAAAIKAFPLLAIIYLGYRRYWLALGSTLVSLAFLLLVLPIPFRGAERTVDDVKRWTRGMIRYDEQGIAQRPARSNTWKNQSIFGVSNRLLRRIDTNATKPPDPPVYANLADLPFNVVNAAILGAGLLLGLCYVGVMPPVRRRTARTDSVEFSLLLLLMLIFTPLSFGYLYVWLMYPFTVTTWLLLTRPAESNRQLLCWSLSALFLLALTIPFPRVAQTYGNIFFATLLLFIGLAWELRQMDRSRTDPATSAPPAPSREAAAPSRRLV